MKSWKTTLAAVLVAATGAATALHYITPELAGILGSLFVALGLSQAKDNNVTGGSVKQ